MITVTPQSTRKGAFLLRVLQTVNIIRECFGGFLNTKQSSKPHVTFHVLEKCAWTLSRFAQTSVLAGAMTLVLRWLSDCLSLFLSPSLLITPKDAREGKEAAKLEK